MQDDESKLRLLERLLRLVEMNLNAATDERAFQHWQRRHQDLVTKIVDLKKKLR
jgi:oligoendopeptidase F